MANGNGYTNGNGYAALFRQLLPLWIFLAAQAAASIWWAATVSSDLRALRQENDRRLGQMENRTDVFDARMDLMDRRMAVFDDRSQRGGAKD